MVEEVTSRNPATLQSAEIPGAISKQAEVIRPQVLEPTAAAEQNAEQNALDRLESTLPYRGPLREDPTYSLVPAPVNSAESKQLQLKLNQVEGSMQDPAANARADSDRTWDSHSANIPNYVLPSEPEFFSSFLSNTLGEENQNTLLLADVVASVYRAFPLIEQARLLARSTAGEQLSALGAYDTKLEGYSLNQGIGYYETYRQGIGAARQLWWGGYIGAGYRLGRGSFEPWYKERETNDGGEFKISMIQPLLQGRAIDAQRVELFQSNLRRQAVGPEVQENILYASLEAANAYWSWVAAGVILTANINLMELAEVRGDQLNKTMKIGQAKGIDLIVNDQLIAERRLKVVESEQKFWQSAAKLSLYLRDEAGQPIVPSPDWLPESFAAIDTIEPATLERDFYDALSRRPELRLIDFAIQEIRWDLELANNQLLPNLDFTIQNSQDVGARASSLGDKTPFELEAGVIGEVPIQRRKARGKIEQSIAKTEMLQQKRRFQQDKILIELQNAQAGLFAGLESIRQAQAALDASRQSLDRYRVAYRLNQVDLVFLNLVEPKVTENQIKLYEQQLKLFMSLAAKQAALGLDPLEQAIALPNYLKTQKEKDREELEANAPKANEGN